MSRWSGKLPQSRRAQVEPLAALVAVFAVGAALTAYAGVLDAAVPTPDRNLAEPTVERVERGISTAGVADPAALPESLSAGPDGYSVNATLAAGGQTWHAGPVAPPSADAADISVSVEVVPGKIRPGRLRVDVWDGGV